MFINGQSSGAVQKQKICFSIQILSVSIKIKFPCKMNLTYEGIQITNWVDLNIRDINHVTQDRNNFVFNQQSLIEKPLNQPKQDIHLTVHLKTVKGSTYQAGIIKINQKELIENQGNNQTLKIPITKSLDSEAFCLIKVQNIQICNKFQLEENKTKKQPQSDFLVETFNPIKGYQFEQARLKSKQSDESDQKKQLKQNMKAQAKPNTFKKQITTNNFKKSFQDFNLNDEKSLIYPNQDKQSQRGSQKCEKDLLKYLNQSQSDQSSHNKNSQNRIQVQKNDKHKTMNTISRRATQQLDERRYSPKRHLIQSQTSSLQMQKNMRNLLFNQYEESGDEFIDLKNHQSGKEKILAESGLFTPINRLQKQQLGLKNYESLALINDVNQEKFKQIMRKSMIRTNNHTNSESSNHIRASHIFDNTNSGSGNINTKQSRISHYHQRQSSPNYQLMGSNSKSGQDCHNCSMHKAEMCQNRVIIEGLQKKLQLVKLSHSESNFVKQQSVLKQESINLLQEKLKASIAENLSLQQINQRFKLQKIRFQRLLQDKQVFIYQLQQEFQQVCLQINRKDQLNEEGQNQIKTMKKQLWKLRRQLVEKEENASLKELQEIQTNSRHKKQLVELSSKINRQIQGQISSLNQQNTKLSNILSKELESIRIQKQNMSKQIAQKQKTIEQLIININNLQQKVRRHDCQKEQNQTVQSQLKKRKQSYEIDIKKLISEKQAIILQSNNLTKDNQNLTKENRQVSDKVTDLSIKLIGSENQIYRTKAQCSRLNSQSDRLQLQCHRRQLQCQRLQLQCQRLQLETNDLHEEKLPDNTESKSNKQPNLYFDYTNQIDAQPLRLSKTTQDLNFLIQRLKKELAGQRHINLNLREDITILKISIAQLEQQNTEIVQQKNLVLTQNFANVQNIQKLRQEIKSLKFCNRQLQLQIKQNQVQNLIQHNKPKKQEETSNTLTSLQSRLLLKQNHQNDLEEQVNYLKQQSNQYKNQANHYKEEISKQKQQSNLFKQAFCKQQQRSKLLKEQNILLNQQLQELRQYKTRLIKQELDRQIVHFQNHQNQKMTSSLVQSSSYHSTSIFQTSLKHSLIIGQNHKNLTQNKQQESYYKQLIRRKDEQIESLMRQLQENKLSLYKVEKQQKLLKQEISMKQDQKKRFLQEIAEEKVRYSKILSTKNQVDIKNSRLVYDLQQLHEQISKAQKQFKQTILEFQQNIESSKKQFDKKLCLKQNQITSHLGTINLQQIAIQQNKKELQSKRKQEKILKQQTERLNREKTALVKEKLALSEQIRNKCEQLSNLDKFNQNLSEKNHSIITQLQLLQKKQFILNTHIDDYKSLQKSLQEEIKKKETLNQSLKAQNTKMKNKIQQIAQIVLEKLSEMQIKKKKLLEFIRNWLINIETNIPQDITKRLSSKLAKHGNKFIQNNQQQSFCFNSQNSVTFFKPLESKLSFAKNQHESRENQMGIQNSISSIIHNNQNIELLSLSKVFGSISVINSQQLNLIHLMQAQQGAKNNVHKTEQKEQKCNNLQQNILLNQSLTNINFNMDNNDVLIDNSFGNINNDVPLQNPSMKRQQLFGCEKQPHQQEKRLSAQNQFISIRNERNFKYVRQNLNIDPFVLYLEACANMDQEQSVFRNLIGQSFTKYVLQSSQNQFLPSKKSQNFNFQGKFALQNDDLAQSSLPKHLNCMQVYFKILVEQFQIIEHNLQQKSKIIQSNLEVISRQQSELQNQQLQFNEWMQKMEQNLEYMGCTAQSELRQLTEQFNLVLKRLHLTEKQLEIKQEYIAKIQIKVSNQKIDRQTHQSNTNKLNEQIQQQKSEINELNYQFCVKEQEFAQEKKLLIEKLTMSNTHLLNLQTQSIKLQHELLRMRNQYESMLQYSEQEKQFLKEKLQTMYRHFIEEKQRRIKAQKLDNFDAANKLYDENQRLKNQIMRLKRQTKMKEISASVIMKEKNEEIQKWRQMVSSVPLNNITKQQSPSKNLQIQRDNLSYGFKQSDRQNNVCNNQVKKQLLQSMQGSSECQYDKFLSKPKQKMVQCVGPYSNQKISNNVFASEDLSTNLRNTVTKKLSFEMANLKHVDSIDSQKTESQKADQLEQIIKKLKSIPEKQQQFSKKQSQLKKQRQDLDQSLKLMKRHKMKRIESIQVDLQTFEKQYKPIAGKGSLKNDQKEFLFITHQENQMQNSRQQNQSNKIPQKRLYFNSEDEETQMVENLKIKPIQPPPLISYSGSYTKSRLKDNTIFNNAKNQTGEECPGQQHIGNYHSEKNQELIFGSEVSSQRIEQIRQYAHIHMVNSEEQIQIEEDQTHEPIQRNQHQRINIRQQLLLRPNTNRNIMMKIVRSISFSHEQSYQQGNYQQGNQQQRLQFQTQMQAQRQSQNNNDQASRDLVMAQFEQMFQ